MTQKLREMTEDYRMFQKQLESIKDNNESNTYLNSNNVSNNDITINTNVNLSQLNLQYKNYKDFSNINIDMGKENREG